MPLNLSSYPKLKSCLFRFVSHCILLYTSTEVLILRRFGSSSSFSSSHVLCLAVAIYGVVLKAAVVVVVDGVAWEILLAAEIVSDYERIALVMMMVVVVMVMAMTMTMTMVMER